MTLNGAITELVLLSEHPMMPVIFRPAIQKVIETISELEAQPEPCEDAVSRKAVKDGFVEMCSLICPYTEKQRHIMCGSCLLGTAFDVLEATQPVTPKQRTGHWHITDAYPHNVYCSECHKRFAQTPWAVWEDGSLPRNFCPNCGAKMEGGAE